MGSLAAIGGGRLVLEPRAEALVLANSYGAVSNHLATPGSGPPQSPRTMKTRYAGFFLAVVTQFSLACSDGGGSNPAGGGAAGNHSGSAGAAGNHSGSAGSAGSAGSRDSQQGAGEA